MSPDLEKALKSLPHGPEFRFLDRLTGLVPGQAGTGEYRVKGEEAFLRGHFPGQPLLPGVLLIEAAAQLAGTVAQSDPTLPPLPGLKLTALRNVKIVATAKPGDVVVLEATVTGRFANLVQAEVTARLGDQLLMQGQVTLGGEKA